MPTIPPSTLVLLVVVPLLLWRMLARVRRMVGRQRLSRVRPWVTLAIFPLLLLALGLGASRHVERLSLLAAGVACGAALGRFGLRHTRFEPTPQGLFYTPNAHLGIALSLLFIGRIAFRSFEVYTLGTAATMLGPDFARSRLTLAIFGLLAGYYIAYAIGLLQWRQRVAATGPAREPVAQDVNPCTGTGTGTNMGTGTGTGTGAEPIAAAAARRETGDVQGPPRATGQAL